MDGRNPYIGISEKATKQIQKLGLRKQFEKQLALFLTNPFHPSLDFKPLKGAVKGVYAFRINDQYLGCEYEWNRKLGSYITHL